MSDSKLASSASWWDDVVVVPREGNHLVFSPSRRLGFLASSGAVAVLRALREGRDAGEDPSVSALLQQVSRVLRAEPRFLPRRSAPKADVAFRPTTAVLLPTMDCSLRCTYCFSRAGDTAVSMPWSLAAATADYVLNNARGTNNSGHFLFHGGGEPTLAWDVLTGVVKRARSMGDQLDVPVTFGIVTNGLLSSARCDWLAENIDKISVSMDGDPEVQDLQRPTAGGGKSSHAVQSTCRRFAARGVKFSIRATVAQHSVGRLEEVTRYLLSLQPRSIQLEPLTSTGRAVQQHLAGPDPQLFIAAFKRSLELAEQAGIELFTSGTRLNRCSTKACGAAGSTFCVTPEGWVTSCHRVSSVLDPAAAEFFYGRFDFERQQFEVDPVRLSKLSSLSVIGAPACRGCLARWHCSGGCYQENYALRNELLLTESIAHCEIKHGLNAYLLGHQNVSLEACNVRKGELHRDYNNIV
jgi:uncharacterized protein